MSVEYNTVALSDSIHFSSVIDPKFKTNHICLYFSHPVKSEHCAASTLAFNLLTESNQRFPSSTALNRRLNTLYSAHLWNDSFKNGDAHMNCIVASVLEDRFALKQEALLEETVQLICDCLFRPNLEGNGFSKTEFAIKQRDLLATIEADINNKRGYAIRQCCRTAFVNEPSAFSIYGTRDEALALTPESVYEVYQTILHTAPIEIFFVGPKPQPQIAEIFQKEFSAIDRSDIIPVKYLSPSPIKETPAEKSEVLPVSQCKLVMAFKTTETNRYAMITCNSIFGQTPMSKLFRNVREKLSLCYYCSSSYDSLKQTLLVDCGVEKKNIETAKAEILHQLDEICQGHITDEELGNTVLSIQNDLKTFGDSPKSYVSRGIRNVIFQDTVTTEQLLDIYSSITKEQIIAAAKSLTLDTVYTMIADETEAEHDES